MMLIEKRDGQRISIAAEHCNEWARHCERAESLLEARPDEAALLLDGLLYRIAREWERQQRAEQEAVLPVAAPEELLERIEHEAPQIGWRLRLALRAPDVRARLAACRALIAAMGE